MTSYKGTQRHDQRDDEAYRMLRGSQHVQELGSYESSANYVRRSVDSDDSSRDAYAGRPNPQYRGAYGSIPSGSAQFDNSFRSSTLDQTQSMSRRIGNEPVDSMQDIENRSPSHTYSLTESYAPNPVSTRWHTDVDHSSHDPAAGGLQRRQTRRVKLVHGSVLSADYPVPSAIQNSVQAKYRSDVEMGSEEFTHLRYTAATCDPDDFRIKEGYNLRPAMYNRHTELLIGVTIYNEDRTMLSRSLHGIMQNIRDIATLPKSQFWNKGGPAWQKVVVCLLVDGIETMDRDLLDGLATVGVYQAGLMKKDIDGKDTTAHIFEYTTQLSVTSNQQLIRPRENQPDDDRSWSLYPVQVILCLKQKNSRKINSHRWLLTAFGRILNPEVVVMLDVGTKPGYQSILALWEAFYNDKDLAGACGEVSVHLNSGWALLNPIIAAQHFEYKVAYQLDRALEASLGYTTVLPGAFAAYRYRALLGRPLQEYFQGDPTFSSDAASGSVAPGIMRGNRFLAEDRLLCFEAVNKAGSKWHLDFVKGAKASTDVPADLTEFLIQRRRWLNGAFASTVHAVAHFPRIYKSGHNIVRMFLLHLQVLYNIVNFLLSWFALAAFLLALFIVNEISGDPPPGTPAQGFPFGKATPIFNAVLQVVYLSMIIVQFLLAMEGRPRMQKLTYTTSFVIFGVIQLYFLVNITYLFKRIGDIRFNHEDSNNGAKNFEYISLYYSDIGDWTVIITGVAAFGVYIVAGFLSLHPWHLFTSYAQFLFVSSSYTNILAIYAFSNIHDVSWGTKGLDSSPLIDQQPSTVAHQTPTGATVIEEPEWTQTDIDSSFEATVKRALAPHKPRPRKQESPSIQDQHSVFRTRLLAVYIFSNFFLCLFVLNDSFKSFHWLGDAYWHKIWFFRIWLWANAGLLYVRLAGLLYDSWRKLIHCCFARR